MKNIFYNNEREFGCINFIDFYGWDCVILIFRDFFDV